MSEEPAARRPLKSRSSAWAGGLSRQMLKAGFTPNLVSVLSVAGAGLAGASMTWAGHSGHPWIFWLLAALGIQFRLVCNLMDGMLAVEGGLKSATGDLFNEIPDRFADALILVPLGYAAGSPGAVALGWAAGLGAVLTAYLRALGAALTGKHDFSGPMAKPQRMAAATAGCLGMMALDLSGRAVPLLFWVLLVINAGIALTCWRRIRRLAAALHERPRP